MQLKPNILVEKFQILSACKIGFEFEFYSDLSPKEVAKSTSNHIGKIVKIPIQVKGFSTTSKIKDNSDFEPTSQIFKIERDFSGGSRMFELITGPMEYNDARFVLIKMFEWIKMYGRTNAKCSIHINLSLNEKRLGLSTLSGINKLKFILGFNEDKIYKIFPNRRDSVYAKSIQTLYPYNKFSFIDNPDYLDQSSFVLPNEKYFGVNFTKLTKNYLEFRYCGGEGYETKTQGVLDLIEYYATYTYNCLKDPVVNDLEKIKLSNILKSLKRITACFVDPKTFLVQFPNVRVTIDLRGDYEILQTYWTHIREKLFDLVVKAKMTAGFYNYDTELSRHQIFESELSNALDIEDFEILKSKIDGHFTNCWFYNCDINSARLDFCDLITDNIVENSKLNETSATYGNVIKDSYILNTTKIVDCTIINGVIRRAIIGENADVSTKTLIVSSTTKNEIFGKTDIHSKNSLMKNGYSKNDCYGKNDFYDKNDFYTKGDLFGDDLK